MADDAQKPAADGEEKSPVFQTGMGAFDRAGFDKSITKGEAAAIKDEDIEKRKTADKVYEEARKYYNKNYEDAIKKIDPAFDKNSPEVSLVAETTFGSNLRKIKKDIDEGKPLDGAKDVLPLAENAAKNRVSLANKLKTGTVTTIAEYVGLSDIKDMDGYGKVAEEFDKTTKDDKNKFEDLLSKFWDGSLRAFNTDTPGAESAMQKLYTPENNAIIAALAKILETEGFSSESVKNMSKRFDENLKEFANKVSQKVEGVSTEEVNRATSETESIGPSVSTETKKIAIGEKETTRATEIPITTETTTIAEPQKLEVKITEKRESNKANTSVPITTTSLEGVKEDKSKQDYAKDFLTTFFEYTPTRIETAKNEERKAESTEKRNETKIKSDEEIVSSDKDKGEMLSFLSSVYGLDDKITTEKSENKIGNIKESSMTVKSTLASSPSLSGIGERLKEKISRKDETISGSNVIKETLAQKLSSVSTPTTDKEDKTSESVANVENTTKETKSEITRTEEPSMEKSPITKEEKSSGMEDKMSMMIALLSQMNETLQGPLLTMTVSKKYD